MNKLKTFIFSTAIVPTLALSSAAMAEEHDNMKEDTEQGASEHLDEKKSDGEQFLVHTPEGAFHADVVIGNSILHRQSDEEIGQIEDLIIGDDGRILGVVVRSGGFLKLGGQEVALKWDQLEHAMEDDDFVLYTEIEEDTLRNLPEYEYD